MLSRQILTISLILTTLLAAPVLADSTFTLMNCELTIYNASDVSKDQLLSAIANHTEVSATPLLQDQNRAMDSRWALKMASDVLYTSLLYEPEAEPQAIVFKIHWDVQPGEKTIPLLLGKNSDIADQFDAYTFRVKCDPVPNHEL